MQNIHPSDIYSNNNEPSINKETLDLTPKEVNNSKETVLSLANKEVSMLDESVIEVIN